MQDPPRRPRPPRRRCDAQNTPLPVPIARHFAILVQPGAAHAHDALVQPSLVHAHTHASLCRRCVNMAEETFETNRCRRTLRSNAIQQNMHGPAWSSLACRLCPLEPSRPPVSPSPRMTAPDSTQPVEKINHILSYHDSSDTAGPLHTWPLSRPMYTNAMAHGSWPPLDPTCHLEKSSTGRCSSRRRHAPPDRQPVFLPFPPERLFSPPRPLPLPVALCCPCTGTPAPYDCVPRGGSLARPCPVPPSVTRCNGTGTGGYPGDAAGMRRGTDV